jgi:membrane protease YdiL (CAAX protease family)
MRESDMTNPDQAVGIARRRMYATARMLGSLLLGGVAVLGSIFVFRQGLLPLIDMALHPRPEWLSAIRRAGILASALAGYWAFVHWHEKREATELRLRPVPLMLGAASGAALVGLPIAVLFALGAYEMVLFRGVSSALLGVAVFIGIAALLEELVYRLVLFRLLERAWGTGIALAVSAAIFAVGHMENVENGGTGTVVAMLVSVTLGGLFWGLVFILTRNLWVVAANHAAWNFTILLSGVPLSGIEAWRKLAPLESRYAGPDWLTGGMFGPECSLLVFVSDTVSVVLLLWWARRRGAMQAPTI